jgi:photosystem II stability/assembly factor-like uncharacterized protein
MRRLLGILSTALLAAGLAAAAPAAAHAASASPAHDDLAWRHVDAPTDQQLRGLDAVSSQVAWVGGSAGGVWRTTDGGRSWIDVSPAGAEGLLFRDVEAKDARTALAMTIGEGSDSRIYRTTDGGRTWSPAFVNDDPRAFYDCMAMYPGDRFGLAMSDPVDGKFRILSTRDGGASWQLVDPAGMPSAVDGEFGFAASGTCLVTSGHVAYLASGGSAARIFASRDRGRTWTVTDSTIPAAPAGGVFSLAFQGGHGIAVGGDFTAPSDGTDASAYSDDRGRSWTNGGDLSGYRSGVDWVRHGVAIAVGPTGSDVTRDGGRTWTAFDDLALDAVQCVHGGACWASGPHGVVVRSDVH